MSPILQYVALNPPQDNENQFVKCCGHDLHNVLRFSLLSEFMSHLPFKTLCAKNTVGLGVVGQAGVIEGKGEESL